MMKKIIYLSIISISLLIFSCETKTDIGYGILPDDDILNLKITDTTSIDVYTLLMDTIATDNISTLLLGEYEDPIFGISKASFVCQYGLAEYPNFTSDHTIDSAVLILALDTTETNYYGNIANAQEITIYKLGNSLDSDSTYYGDQDPSVFMTELDTIIGQKTYSYYSGDTIVNIRLDQAFAEQFKNLASNISNDEFRSFLKGVYITSNTANSNGAILKYIINSNSVINVYSHTDSETYIFKVTSNLTSNIKFNIFKHNYIESSFYSQINIEDEAQDSVAYIQAMGGLRTKIQFPFIEQLKDLGDIAIYRAELVVNTAPSLITEEASFPVIDKLILTGYNPDDEYYLLPEYNSINGYQGVSIDDGSYKFDIAGYIRDILDGNVENNGLLLFSYSGSTEFNRSIITTGNHSDRMKLYISYTKL